jgi:3-oxoacyl-(acyl-carrier-protein) synthase
MDKTSRSHPRNPVVLTGIGYEISPEVERYLITGSGNIPEMPLSHDCNPSAFLRVRKTLKFMSKQDRLALSAAGKALRDSQVPPEILTEKCGVFMAVGYIAFRRADAEELCRYAQDYEGFSMKRFSTEGFDRINPMLAFFCLPNMPAHHLSANFDLQGPYLITYPGSAQFYTALLEAVNRLQEGNIQAALVGATADQSNFLTQNQYQKLFREKLVFAADAAAFLVLELAEHAESRGKQALARLVSLENSGGQTGSCSPPEPQIEFGPVALSLGLAAFLHGKEKHLQHFCPDQGRTWSSCWERL